MASRFIVAMVLLAVASCTRPQLSERVPYETEFSGPDLGREWSSRGGRWRQVDGKLVNDGAHNAPLWLSASLPADVRVTFVGESRSPAVDIKFEIFGDGQRHESGYVVIFSGWNNSKSIIARMDEHGPERTHEVTEILRREVSADPEAAARRHRERREIAARPNRGASSRAYRFRFERREHLLQLFIDDELHLQYFDPSPMSGEGHDRFAFNNWQSDVAFDELKIEGL